MPFINNTLVWEDCCYLIFSSAYFQCKESTSYLLRNYNPRKVSGTVNWCGTTLISVDMDVTCVILDRNSVGLIQMYLLDQFREFLTSLNVFLGGVPLGWPVPLASCLLYICVRLAARSRQLCPKTMQPKWSHTPALYAPVPLCRISPRTCTNVKSLKFAPIPVGESTNHVHFSFELGSFSIIVR